MADQPIGSISVDFALKIAGFKEGTSDVTQATQKMSRQATRDINAITKATDPLQYQMEQMAQRVVRLNSAYDRLADKGSAAGTKIQKSIAAANTELAAYQKLQSNPSSAASTGPSEGQLRFARSTLPAQFTDIATQLQGGQNPLTILIEQGGQIRDSFGGVGVALKETSSALMGMINPVTLLVGVVGGLVAAWYSAEEEMSKYNKAAALVNGVSGTGSQLQSTADQVGELTNNYAAAGSAVQDFASTGQYSLDQIVQYTQSVADMNTATGTSVQDLVSQYTDLAKDPVQALVTLNNQYGFLNQSQLEHIQHLVDIGDQYDAAKAAQDAWAAGSDDAAKRVIANMDNVDKAINAIKNGWHSFWTSLKQETSDSYDQLSSYFNGNMNGRLQILQSRQQSGALSSSGANELKSLTDIKTAMTAIQGVQAQITQDQKEGVNAAAQAHKQAMASLSGLDLYKQKLIQIQQIQNQEEKAGPLTSQESSDLERLRDQAKSQYESSLPKAHKTRQQGYQDDAATRMLENLRQQDSQYQAQLSSQVQLTSAVKQQLTFEQQIADIRSRIQKGQPITKDQQSLYSNQGAIRSQLSKNVSDQNAIQQQKRQKDSLRVQQQIADLNDNLAQKMSNTQQQDALALMGIGVDPNDLQNAQKLLQIQQSTNDQISKYQNQLSQLSANDPDYDNQKKLLNAQIANTQQMGDFQTNEQMQNYAQWQQNNTGLGGITTGASEGISSLLGSTDDTASTMQQSFTSAFSAMNESLTNFVSTGKLSFSSLIESMAQSLANLGLQIAESSILQALFGSSSASSTAFNLTGGSSGSSSSISTSALTSALQLSGSFFASGGHVKGAGTSTSDSIPAMLSNGEYVLNAKAVNRLGVTSLDAINSGKHFATGGYVNSGGNVYTSDTTSGAHYSSAAANRVQQSQSQQKNNDMQVSVINNNGSGVRTQRIDPNHLAVVINDDITSDGPVSRTLFARTTASRRNN